MMPAVPRGVNDFHREIRDLDKSLKESAFSAGSGRRRPRDRRPKFLGRTNQPFTPMTA
jgi:hypothetical protein